MKKFGLALCILLALAFTPVFSGCQTQNGANITYEISCSLTDNILTGVEKVTFTNFTDNTFTQLKFNLFGNAFRQNAEYKPISAQYTSRAYPHGMSYGQMSIQSVTSGKQDLEYAVCGKDENILAITLNNELFPDESVTVEIAFTLTLATVVSRTGVNDKTVNLGNFYPELCGIQGGSFYECVYYSTGDPFFSDVSDFNVSIELDSKYVVASSGKKVSESKKGERQKLNYSLKKARSFAFVLSENYKTVTDNSLGVEITYYYYNDATPERSLACAVKSIKLFCETFGEYPYPTYAVTQTQFVQGGMEYPALVMIADDLESNAYEEVIVHETAHQWWQTTVGNNEIEYGFLDEGLAEYSVVLFYENNADYGMNRETLIRSSEQTYKVFCSVYDKIFGNVNTVMLRNLSEFSSEYEYVNMAYIKPCIMYDYLRQTIGDELFFKGLKRYYKEYSFKNATPDNLVGAFEKIGADTNGFFDSFFTGKVII